MKIVYTTLVLVSLFALGMFIQASKADAQIQSDLVTANINLPMLRVAMTGPDMSLGTYSPNVRVLESFLQNRGYFPQNVAADDAFDLTTLQALQAYQYQAHISSTGYFGPYTRAHMWVVLWFNVNGVHTPYN
jgi:peptidoglycan hydrolase-like protein with peptidoglycan-binding domain